MRDMTQICSIKYLINSVRISFISFKVQMFVNERYCATSSNFWSFLFHHFEMYKDSKIALEILLKFPKICKHTDTYTNIHAQQIYCCKEFSSLTKMLRGAYIFSGANRLELTQAHLVLRKC